MNSSRKARLRSGYTLTLIAGASLAAATLLTACQTLTVDFVYVASAKAAGQNNDGEIDVYEINSESGFMRQIPTSPFPSGGRNPVAEAVSADNQNLFVVNHDDNTIVQFIIGSDGKLYPYNTINTPGIFPLAVAANKTNLFVVDTYQPLPICSPASPCSGSIAAYGLNAASGNKPITIGSAAANPAVSGQYWPLALGGAASTHIIVPTGVTVLSSGAYVYVSAYDSSVTPATGYIFGFSVGANGALTALANSPFAAGVQPSSITSDPKGNYVYATDSASGNVRGYAVASGNLTPLSGSPYPSGNQPMSMAIDPSYAFAYVANALDATVTAYSVSNGVLAKIGNNTYATGLNPVAIGIDPSTNHFLYTVNFLSNNVSGFQLSKTDGTLTNTQLTPYPSNAQPTAVAAVPHNGTGSGVQ